MGKDVLSERDSPLWSFIDRSWLRRAVGQDPAHMESATRFGLDHTLELHTWLDPYQPRLILD